MLAGCFSASRAPAADKPPVADQPVADGMVRVPGGEFVLGSPPDVGLEDEQPQRRIHLDTFDIDRTEVSSAEYKRCVAAGQCTEPACAKADHKPETRGDHPVVCVTWDQADRFCRWAGKRLPTELEWEKAARGTDGRKYPWGNEPPSCERARYTGCGDGTHAVGALASASPYGALDMAGNVWEWVADWHHAAYYAIAPARNPVPPFTGDKKVVRGGSFSYGKDNLTTHGRTFDVPTIAYDHVGIRCARAPR
jgi:formylglycine-generating enzyme required for sulfatase activity